MEAASNLIFTTILNRFAQPARAKFLIYQIVLQYFIEKLILAVNHKYDSYFVKIRDKFLIREQILNHSILKTLKAKYAQLKTGVKHQLGN